MLVKNGLGSFLNIWDRSVTRGRRRKQQSFKPWSMVIAGMSDNWDKQLEAESKKELGFLQWGKHYFPEWFRSDFNSIHEWLESDIMPQLLKPANQRDRSYSISLIAPRGAAKSTILAFLLPIYAVCYKTEYYILLCSSAWKLAKDQLADIKNELESNKALIADFPHVCGVGSTWNKEEIKTKNGVWISTAGAEKAIRGIKKEGRRPSLIIFDDPEPQSAKTSEAIRKRGWDFLTDTLIPAGEERVTNFVVAGTVLHRECLVLRLEKNPLFESKRKPAIISEPDFPHLWSRWKTIITDMSDPKHKEKARQFYDKNKRAMNTGVETFWPSKFGYLELMEKKLQVGSNSFEQEYMCRAVNSTGHFNRQEISEDALFVARAPDEYYRRIMVIDPAIGEKESNDDSAIIDGILGTDRRVYASSYIRKLKPVMLAATIVDLVERAFDEGAPFGMVFLEGNGFQKILKKLIDDCYKKKLKERKEEGRKLFKIPLKIFNSSDNKELRIMQLEPYLTRGQIKLVKTRSRVKLHEQLQDFPNSDHDDGIDTLAMTVIRLSNKRKRKR